MIKAKVSADYKDIERIFAGGSIQKEILKIWSTEADAYVFEAWKILEMEGPLPLTIRANGEPLIDYCIYGNTEQTGTPTPENPIMPIGCGERTENLCYRIITNATIDSNGRIVYDTSFDVALAPVYQDSYYSALNPSNVYAWFMTEPHIGSQSYNQSRNAEVLINKASPLNGFVAVRYTKAKSSNAMLNAGSTPLPYEPYGYKLPILSNSTVTSIYLGEVPATRRIKKLVLTGGENWKYQSEYTRFTLNLPTAMFMGVRRTPIICTHYISIDDGRGITSVPNNTIYIVGSIALVQLAIKTDIYTTLTEWNSFLAAQYAAGTPVTIWFAIAEPETGIVNEPLMKIGDYADTIDSAQANVQIPTSKGTTILDYDGEDRFITSDGYELVDKNQNGFLLSGSTLRPSKMYIKYKGR